MTETDVGHQRAAGAAGGAAPGGVIGQRIGVGGLIPPPTPN